MELNGIGEWSEDKLDIIAKYATPYMNIMSTQYFHAHYIDGFCGAGFHLRKTGGDVVDGSPLRVLKVAKPFTSYYFIDSDRKKTDILNEICEEKFSDRKIEVINGDCNKVLMQLLPKFSWKNYDRLFCLLDPYGLHLQWDVVKEMGNMGIVDLLLHFPIMDMNRNAIWRNPDKIPQDGIERMNSFWGDETWKDIAYKESPQQDMFGSPAQQKQSNEAIVEAFRKRLKKCAKFKYVPKPIPLKNSRNAVIYYLFFASQNKIANKIAKDVLENTEQKHDRF